MDEAQRPSKSQRKRDMTALQKTGAQLVELNADQLAQFELPERLHDAVLAAQRIRDFEGRRRQLQYIGKLMREVDPLPIRAKLGQWLGSARQHTALQRNAERWRERLLADEHAVALFAADYPRGDLQHLRTLIASVKRDQTHNQPPKRFRELYRAIHDAIARSSAPEDRE